MNDSSRFIVSGDMHIRSVDGTVKALLLAVGFAVGVSAAEPTAAPRSFLVEAEDFQFTGEWIVEGDATASGRRMLRTPGANADAITVIDLPQAGNYAVWVRARDYVEYPGKRRYKLGLDSVLFEPEFGAHGVPDWKWEKAGERTLEAGDHVLALRDTAKFYGRADAVLLTTSNVDPNTLGSPLRGTRRLTPKAVPAEPVTPFAAAPALTSGERSLAACLENEHVRIRFVSGLELGGKSQILRETELKIDGAWHRLGVEEGGEKLFLLFAPKVEIRASTMLPSWTSDPSCAPLFRFKVGEKSFEAMAGRGNPFYAAPAQVLVSRSASQVDPQTVGVEFETPSGWKGHGRWVLRPGARDLEFAFDFKAPQDGFYSVGFSPFQGWKKEQVRYDLLSPVFQFQRLPESPVLVPSNSTPQPLAMAQIEQGGQAISLAVAADPDRLPFVWANSENAAYGFSLLNTNGAVQPAIFAPVLGQPNSHLKSGESHSLSCRVLSFPGDWTNALEYASQEIYRVTDYRKPFAASLTDAALNMIDLIKHDEASGWNPERKGFWNIETTNVASQASPLSVVSAAVLTRDEEFYRTRALPTIEYTLSRPQAHFGMEVPTTRAPYINQEGTKIKVPSDFYGTAYWQGLHDLLGRKNPWLGEIALPKGEIRHRAGYSSVPRWSEMMAAYRLKPGEGLLAEIKKEADKFLAKEVYGLKTKDLGLEPFYNVSYYPYWWDLLDLFELTSDEKYLDAAEQSAFFTIAGIWSHPRVPDGEIVIHPGGEYAGEPHLWWKGDQPFRLGLPRQPGAVQEKKVPAWLVAQMGLGLEQPCTYYTGKGGMRNIMMSAWAPNLLRLFRYTGREIYRVYARNSVLSRFANYPGYYISGYTDLELQAGYPYRGPDVTSIYYHHIPPHLAFTIDFLVTEAEQRSNGRIAFPWVKQQGYVWFSNRIYGEGPGKVFGDDTARLWLDRKYVQVKTPAVNYLLARGNDHVWLILMNEGSDVTLAPVSLDCDALGVRGDSVRVLEADGKNSAKPLQAQMSIPVPPKGLVALSFEAQPERSPAIPALDGGRVNQTLPGEWGRMEAFRIRSPFGKDSLYAVLTGRPKDGVATLKLAGAKPVEKKTYPYEFSIYPLPMDKDLRFSLELSESEGRIVESPSIVLPGNRPAR